MTTASAFRAEPAPVAGTDTTGHRRVLIWDAPVRVFHWLMVLSFAGAWLTAESERFRLLHVTLGYTMAGLVAFRLVWGLVGTRHARFAAFVRGPRAVAAYLGRLLRGEHGRDVGHNPAGALAILGLLVLALAVTASGWAMYDGGAGEWLEDVHEAAASGMLGLVALHVAGVALASVMSRQNLVATMVSGHKLAPPAQAIRSAWHSVAALMLVAVVGFWGWQWQSAGAPAGEPVHAQAGADPALVHTAAGRHGHDDDDD